MYVHYVWLEGKKMWSERVKMDVFTILYSCRYSWRCYVSTHLVLALQDNHQMMTFISLAMPFPREQ